MMAARETVAEYVLGSEQLTGTDGLRRSLQTVTSPDAFSFIHPVMHDVNRGLEPSEQLGLTDFQMLLIEVITLRLHESASSSDTQESVVVR